MKKATKATRKKAAAPVLYLTVTEWRPADVPAGRHVTLLINRPKTGECGYFDTERDIGSLCKTGLISTGLIPGAKYRLVRIKKGKLSE